MVVSNVIWYPIRNTIMAAHSRDKYNWCWQDREPSMCCVFSDMRNWGRIAAGQHEAVKSLEIKVSKATCINTMFQYNAFIVKALLQTRALLTMMKKELLLVIINFTRSKRKKFPLAWMKSTTCACAGINMPDVPPSLCNVPHSLMAMELSECGLIGQICSMFCNVP